MMKLTEAEKKKLTELIQAGKPLPAAYRDRLFGTDEGALVQATGLPVAQQVTRTTSTCTGMCSKHMEKMTKSHIYPTGASLSAHRLRMADIHL